MKRIRVTMEVPATPERIAYPTEPRYRGLLHENLFRLLKSMETSLLLGQMETLANEEAFPEEMVREATRIYEEDLAMVRAMLASVRVEVVG